MADRAHPRPKLYPPPEFPPRKVARFARMPPAVFPAILGLFGLGLALRRGLEAAGLPGGVAEAVLGAVAGAGLNAAFLGYYREVAHVRFGLLRLCERHGAERVIAAFGKAVQPVRVTRG